MSILIIGDIHIKTNNERQTNILMLDIIEIIHNNNIAFVVILGDTLDNHGKIDMECLCRAGDLFEMIISTGKHLFVLIGNHDRKNNKDFMTNRHPFRGWSKHPGITIIERTHVFDFPVENLFKDENDISSSNINAGNMKFCFVPYVPNDMYMDALKNANVTIEEITMFFSHQEFDGCKINKLSNAKCDVWNPEWPLNISGHIHDYEIVQGNLIYLGTPYQQTYADSPDKGVWLLDLKSAFTKCIDENGNSVISQTGEFKLSKKDLRIPQKVIWKVHYNDLQNIVLDEKLDIRLDIYGPTALVREIMNRPDMKAKFANIVKKYKEETKDDKKRSGVISRSKGDFHFLNAYLTKLTTDPRMLGVHMSLFPQSNIDQMRQQLTSMEPVDIKTDII